jgi:hypothetical protein
VVALRGIAVALLLAVDFADLEMVDRRLSSPPKPSGADAEVDIGGGEVNKLCEVGGGAVAWYI